MQRSTDNSAETYIVCKPVAVRPIKADIPGEGASGPPTSVVAGVSAVEEMPTRDLFGLCSPEDCISSCEDDKFTKRITSSQRRLDTGDTIIGITERCPGESKMSASAVNTDRQEMGSTKKPAGLVYSSTDFRPYQAR